MKPLLEMLKNVLSDATPKPSEDSERKLTLQREVSSILNEQVFADLNYRLTLTQDEVTRTALTVAFKALAVVLERDIHEVSEKVLEALVEASKNPEFNAYEVITNDAVAKANEGYFSPRSVSRVYGITIFFDLLRNSALSIGSYYPVLNMMLNVTGHDNFEDLRGEPDDYLAALMRMFVELPLELVVDNTIPPAILNMVKDDPSVMTDIMAYAIQRQVEISYIDPEQLKEAIATPSMSLREGAL